MVLRRLRIQACFVVVALSRLKPSAIDGKCNTCLLLAGGKSLCVSGEVDLCQFTFTLEFDTLELYI